MEITFEQANLYDQNNSYVVYIVCLLTMIFHLQSTLRPPIPVAYNVPKIAKPQKFFKNGNNQSDNTAMATAILLKLTAERNFRSAMLPKNKREGMLTMPC